MDCSARTAQLQPLTDQRAGGSLSGLPSELIAIGGFSKKAVSICEKYLTACNKWRGLPPLKAPRHLPGSALLETKRAFCFCGHQPAYLNTIESIQTDTEVKWKTVPLNEKVPKTFHLAVVSTSNKLVVFGGRSYHSLHSFIFSEEAELE